MTHAHHGGDELDEILVAIEARLSRIERDVSETESWIARRFDAIDRRLHQS